MKEELGKKKVVYKDGDYVKVVEGSCTIEEPFICVQSEMGNVYVNKNAVIVIK
jgi:hypothetical protein